ncbi:MAG: SynChlorMet cassette radical SAM/SPASM protein ScmF [Deltaproteobacteria bacterium]|nr:SynChlorMet cassette radical SAM/SPASM protein ScmF [Deltaproteobacteria bacterium]
MPTLTTSTDRGEARLPRLEQIYFYLTAGCNLACRHCWLAPKFDPDGSRYPTLPVALFERAIAEALPLGLTGVKLTGGEPLLHPRIEELLAIVGERDLALTLESNGLLCTPRLAAAIAQIPKRAVAISIDGVDAATHDGVRGVAGSFDRAVQAVRDLVAADTPPQIIMSIMRYNLDQVDAMVRLAEKLGASSVKFNLVQPAARGQALYDTERAVSVANMIALGRRVATELAPATRLRLDFDLPPAFRPLSAVARGDGRGICNITAIIGVLPTGHYALCGIGEHIPELVFGQIEADPLARVWRDNEVLRTLRAGLPDRLEGVCADCLMRHRCLGSCVAQNFYEHKNLFAPFWFCERACKDGIFPQSRLAGRRAQAADSAAGAGEAKS